MSRFGLTPVLLAALGVSARADVSSTNGNFSVGYTDIESAPGFGLCLERVYNSKSSFTGMFGLGWGSDYELYLTPQPDGSVVLHENGGGAETTFTPPTGGTEVVEPTVAAIVAARKAVGDLRPDELAAYQQRLRTDERFRHDEANNLHLPPVAVAPGTKLVSTKYGYSEITRTDAGYEFTRGDQTWELDDRGVLQRAHDRNGHWVQIERDGNGRIHRLVDDLKHWIQLDIDEDGHVIRAVTSDAHVARYRYHDGAMVTNFDADGKRFEYQWDARKNLLRIGYSDGTETAIAYDPMERGESVRLVRAEDGTVTSYERIGTDPGALEYGERDEVRDAAGEVISVKSTLYTDRIKANGAGRYRYREEQEIDSSKWSTTYNEDGKPLEVIHDGVRTAYRYDDHGHVTLEDSPIQTTVLSYGPLGKVTHVKVTSHASPSTFEASYAYDARANLAEATTSAGLHIALTYDSQGRIKTARTHGGGAPDHDVLFEYDPAQWKPTRLTVKGVGSITLIYDEDGALEDVKGDGGKVERAVETVFQSMIDAVHPAGVEL